jgi:hypothetical protein
MILALNLHANRQTHNNRKEDARLLYMMELASSRFGALVELRTFMAPKRDDFFAVDVRRHAAAQMNH